MGHYLTTIFDAPAKPAGLYAESVGRFFGRVDSTLLQEAWTGRSPTLDASMPTHERARLVFAHSAVRSQITKASVCGDTRRCFRQIMPDAQWYVVENFGPDYASELHFIVDGEQVTIAGPQGADGHWPRPFRVSKTEALAAIYGAIRAVEVVA